MNRSIVGMGGIGTTAKRAKSNATTYVFSVEKWHDDYYGKDKGEWVSYPDVKVKRANLESADNYAKTNIPWPYRVSYRGFIQPGYEYSGAKTLTAQVSAFFKRKANDKGPVSGRRVSFR